MKKTLLSLGLVLLGFTSVYAQHEFNDEQVIAFSNRNFPTFFAQDKGDGVLSGDGVTDNCYWQLIPTDNANCYYIRNMATDMYVQSCNYETAYNGPKVKMGTTPVEYCILKDETAGHSTYGYYGIASTDQDCYDFSDSECIGWNLVQGSCYITGYNAKMGANAKSFWTIHVFASQPSRTFDNEWVTINSIKEPAKYMQDSSQTDSLIVGANNDKSVWQLVPSIGNECYYVKNVTTGRYIQSCNYDHYNTVITVGDTPVEFSILKDEIEGRSTSGAYGFASTDQDETDFQDASCIGLNCTGSNYVTAYDAKVGVNVRSFWTINIINHDFTEKDVLAINNRNFPTFYAQDNNAGSVKAGELNNNSYWQAIPTVHENCYYLKNIATGLYAQTTEYTVAYNGPEIGMGETPVEYCIRQDTTETSSTYNYWGLASTDQDCYDFTDGECIGWNLVQGAGYVTGYNAKMGANAKSFWTITKLTEVPTHQFNQEFITIANRNFPDKYIQDNMTENDSLVANELNDNSVWQLVPTLHTNCYYVKNATTARYIQSCRAEVAYNGPCVLVGDTPVEYHVAQDTVQGRNTFGYWGLCSTDQDETDFQDAECVGLNYANAGFVTGYNAKMGANPKSFWTIAVVEHEFNADQILTIANRNFPAMFAQENGREEIGAGELNENAYWRFIPTIHANCYYVQNIATDLYAQSTEYSVAYNGPIIDLNDTPIEYCILKDTVSSHNTYGYYGLCSTDQDCYDFSDQECIGWNLAGGGFVTGYNAQMGVNAKSFWTITDIPTAIESIPVTEEKVVNNVKKVFSNGQFFILQGDKKYSISGVRMN